MMNGTWCGFVAFGVAIGVAGGAAAQITNLEGWTLVEDPDDANFGSLVESPSSILLTASDASPGSILGGTDIGYQSVDGGSVAGSGSGFAFRVSESFLVSVDYSAAFQNAGTGLTLGFGIGEDGLGANSAGVGLVTQGGQPAAIPFVGPAAGLARVNDVNVIEPVSPALSSGSSSLTGSLHVFYDAATGNIAVGVGEVGAAAPANVAFFDAADVTSLWAGTDLLVTFFIRSDTVEVPFFGVQSTPWTTGSAEVRFSNLRVGAGRPFRVGCTIDANADGLLDAADVSLFLTAIDAGFDFDGSGAADVFDVINYLDAFDEGCP